VLDYRATRNLSSKIGFPNKDFALIMHIIFGTTYMCENTFSTMKQVRSKNRNRMGDRTIVSDWYYHEPIGIVKGTILSEKPQPQASH